MTSQLQFTSSVSDLLLGQNLGIRLVNLNAVDAAFPVSNLEVDFDHVRLSAVSAVPEPSSMVMFSIAAISLAAFRRRSPGC